MISDSIKLAIIKTAPTLSHIELIELVEHECELTQKHKPLTNEQIKKASLEAGMQEHYMDFHSGFIKFAKAIEAAHGIKENK